MSAPLKQSDIDSKTDPSVARQWDNEVPFETKLEDLYSICDGLKVCMLGTARPNVGVRLSVASHSDTVPSTLYTK